MTVLLGTTNRRRLRGQALIPVLMVVLIITAFAVTIVTSSHREVKAADNSLKDVQAYFIARGAVNYTAAVLQQATNGGDYPANLTQPPDTDGNGWTQFGDGFYKVDVIDTSSRININTASAAELARLPICQLTDPSIAANIIDWRDADDTPTIIQSVTGAESDYYQSLTPPYNAKNAPFDTVEELLLVKGITPAIFYGQSGTIPTSPLSDPANNRTGLGGSSSTPSAGLTRQAQTTGGAASTAVDTTQSTTPLGELLTTYSKELNVSADGQKRLNVRTVTAAALQTALTSAGVAAADIRNLTRTFDTQKIQVTSLSDLLGKTNGTGGQLVAPWTRAVLQKCADKLTVRDDQFLNGLINLNTASPEVIATIPGMTQDLYNLLIQQRQAGTVYNSINDLFTGTTFTVAQLKILLGTTCTKSSTYIIRVRVRMPGTTKVYASQALVEMAPPQASTTSTTGTSSAASGTSGTTPAVTLPQILQWKEVGRTPGWTSWMPAPNYYNTGTLGGTVGN